MDYQFLIGERFEVKGELFAVQTVRRLRNRMVVDARTPDRSTERAFPVELVIDALVSEEIELFGSNVLTAA